MSKKKLSLEEIELERNAKLSPLLKISIFLLSILLISAGLFAVALSINKNTEPPEPTAVEKIDRTLTGNTVSEDQQTAILTTVTMLNGITPAKSQEDLLAELDRIENGDLSSFNEDYKSLIYFPTIVESDLVYQALTHQSLYSLAAILSNFGENEIAPISESSYQDVYFDELTARAFVPITLFSLESNPIVLELIYIDGEWLIDPYSYVQAIKMSAMLQANNLSE